MDCRVPQSCSLVMERPGPSSPEIMSPENFSPVSGKVLDGRDGLLGYLLSSNSLRAKSLSQHWRTTGGPTIATPALTIATLHSTSPLFTCHSDDHIRQSPRNLHRISDPLYIRHRFYL
jgi:hypothetical protein